MAAASKTDHPHARISACGDSRKRIFDHDAIPRQGAASGGRVKEEVGCRLPAGDLHGAEAPIEQVVEPGHGQGKCDPLGRGR
jgi:hypothetical protein